MGPPGFTKEQSRRESGGHLFPRLQASGTSLGPGAGLHCASMQASRTGLQGVLVGGLGRLRKGWVLRPLHRVSPSQTLGLVVGDMKAG